MYQKGTEAVDATGKIFSSWKRATDHLERHHAINRHTLLEESDHLKVVSIQAWNADMVNDKSKAVLTYFLVDVTPIAIGYVSATETFKNGINL